METWFELWDNRSSNLVGEYETQADALNILRIALEKHGVDAISQLTLVGVQSKQTIISMGDDLAELARKS